MEWVNTMADTVEAATDEALELLGVTVDEVELEVLEEPQRGLFGRVRGQARVRARLRPAELRQKNDRLRRPKGQKSRGNDRSPSIGSTATATVSDTAEATDAPPASNDKGARGKNDGGSRRRGRGAEKGTAMNNDTSDREPVDPAVVGDAAVAFMDGLVAAFGATATVTLDRDGTELEVRVDGEELGLMVGPGGRTLTAIQDIARVAAQRKLGDHDTHLRIDVAGYRQRRRASLEAFAKKAADKVRETGKAIAIEPMASPDRKVIHDVLSTEDGVGTRSEGEDPNRRVVVFPD
ncbi:MAG: Jag N-terminal domain-containing protein [Actinomycetota bacterium]|nr:Jag N-terminal domain-containing protein [Actinomycetota bacterium]MDA3007163.1 Jag N-terminal domain-containing protein [Actinomycetota bacterium]MDA3034071.1 Jag N-terminal domain-containing protein [Actinomycetota bacterium]